MAPPSDSAASGGDTRLRAYLRPYKGRLAFGVLLLLLTNAFDKAIPWVLQNAIDALEGERFGDVRSAALTVLAIAAGLWIFRTRSRIQVFNVGRDVEYDLRNELIDNVHRLGPTFFRKMATGEVMSRATSDLGQVRLLVGFGVLQVVDSIFAFGGAIALMLALSPELTLYAMAPFPMIIFLARFFGKRLYQRSREHQEALAKLADVAQENLAGVRVVRAYAIEDAEQRRFDVANQAAVDASMRLVVLRGFMWPLLLLVASVGTLIVIWQGGQMVLDDRLSVGELAAFNAYLAQLVWPTLALGWLLSVVQRGRAGYDRVRTILDAEPEVFSDGELEPTGPGAMEVAGLEYTVHEDGEAVPILRGVDLAVPAKGSLAIMGTVGSGKSTLAALLPRLAPTPRGAVFLDGRDVTDVELRALRKAVGYAQQEPFLFSTTVERNIAFGMEDPDAPGARGRIEAAAEEACILDEIATLPDGMETLVGERGVQLSGGQKQRIALARALLNEPQVIVLDDPMSAVDARTEAQILRALDRAGEGRTLILVTHRVAAASRCERIVVLDEGRIVERGTHAELVAAGGRYAALAERQQLEEELQRASEPPQPPEAAS